MGLSYEELQELLEYIEKNHSWKNMYKNHVNTDKPPKTIKYVTFDFDTRDCDIWQVRFYNICGCEDITFRTEQGYNFKDKIYDWLKN
jgi:hypothetical protein